MNRQAGDGNSIPCDMGRFRVSLHFAPFTVSDSISSLISSFLCFFYDFPLKLTPAITQKRIIAALSNIKTVAGEMCGVVSERERERTAFLSMIIIYLFMVSYMKHENQTKRRARAFVGK
jgi:hypothetical protein